MIAEVLLKISEAIKTLTGSGKSIEGWLLEYGEDMTSLPQVQCPEQIQGEPKMCFYNSGRIAQFHHGDWTYCEGYAISPTAIECNFPLPMHHAWLIDGDGNIVDPTWEPGGEYFGLRFSTKLHSELISGFKYWDVLYYLARNYNLADGEWELNEP